MHPTRSALLCAEALEGTPPKDASILMGIPHGEVSQGVGTPGLSGISNDIIDGDLKQSI